MLYLNKKLTMLGVTEVDRIIHKELKDFSKVTLPLEKCVGKVLKEEIRADRDFPPFNRVMMDGIGIQFKQWEQGKREFTVEGLCAAGDEAKTLLDSQGCLEVMTGTVMPSNADTVVKYEHVTINNGLARIEEGHEITRGQHIHLQGTDRVLGDLLIEPERIITSADVAVLATVGKSEVVVAKSPKIAVVATGDELVDIHETPKPHQIRKSNVHAIISDLQSKGFTAEAFHFVDDQASLRNGLKSIIEFFDVVVMSGGVSKGKFDYIPGILDDIGVEKKFHFVRQRPGKPFWFGRYKKGVVFALPGNPVSTFVGLYRYVLPYLYRSSGIEPVEIKAVLAKDFNFKPGLTYFLQVKLSYDSKGTLQAMPVPGLGSGDLANLLDADALLELPDDKSEFKKGEVFTCYKYR